MVLTVERRKWGENKVILQTGQLLKTLGMDMREKNQSETNISRLIERMNS